MGYLLKEALKTLCGVNKWSYAIFWKIGCQNPKLLIWEECYYEPIIYANIAHGVQVGSEVHSLVTKMMTENYVNLLGEGLVGRAAFTGSHQWILLDDKTVDAYPPEVSNEVHMQFSAGMQTIAVIPVHPHGVVQLGSSLTIMENMGFLNDVKSLIFQLGCVPGALLSETYMNNENTSDVGPNFLAPCGSGNNVSSHSSRRSKMTASTLFPPGVPEGSGSTGHTSVGRHIVSNRTSGDSKLSGSVSFQSSMKPDENHCQADDKTCMKKNFLLRGKQQIAVFGEATSQNQGVWLGQGADLYIQDPQTPFGLIAGNHDPFKSLEQKISSDSFKQNYVSEPKLSQITGETSKAVQEGLSTSSNKRSLSETHIPGAHVDPKCMQPKLTSGQEKLDHELFQELTKSSEEACHKPSSGDDLFDVVGVNFRNKLFEESWYNFANNHVEAKPQNLNRNNSAILDHKAAGSDLFSVAGGESDSDIFLLTANDHLLDAVVSRLHSCSNQVSDDNLSCSTSLTKTSGSSAPIIASTSGGPNRFINLVQGELTMVPKSLPNTSVLSSCSFKSGISKEEGGSLSETSSLYSSQIRSWIEKGNDVRKSSGVSSECSKKPDENSKSNRKRLKPGENPRPRPKDRQMIQDRVKELREIVPNGAKCSIDALLERTIKHMLFLQSVTMHADKLKQDRESKIVSKDGGLLLRDNFEGGATWAYEVSSQSMVCPIIVEDLNSPRQMLVEMLCEERGLFLEIADFIRGLGLTILKGVMESRNDKIWARFTVEANRDVTRMEIFLSLVRLLEQPVKNNAALADCSDSVNTASQHSLHQVASIPASGGPCGLQ